MTKSTRASTLSVMAAFVLGSLLSTCITLAIVHPGLARADAPTATPTMIYTCVDKSGALRIVSATDTCKKNETALQWNQQGPAGPAGPQGPQGPAGTTALPFLCPQCVFSADGLGERLAGQNLSGSYMEASSLRGADLSGTNFSNSSLEHTDFTGANLTSANLTNAGLAYTEFVSANLTNANLTSADLTNADLTSATGWSTAVVTGVIWSNTTCPDGTNSDTNVGNTCVGH